MICLFFGDFFVKSDFVNFEWADKIYDVFSKPSDARRRAASTSREVFGATSVAFGCCVAGSAGDVAFGFRRSKKFELKKNCFFIFF